MLLFDIRGMIMRASAWDLACFAAWTLGSSSTLVAGGSKAKAIPKRSKTATNANSNPALSGESEARCNAAYLLRKIAWSPIAIRISSRFDVRRDGHGISTDNDLRLLSNFAMKLRFVFTSRYGRGFELEPS
jgi:hypothetical protein